jgi:SAM-dependent methyltransferase
MTAQDSLIAAKTALPNRPQRPSFRLSDVWRAPLNDFPIRDEILYQYLPLSSSMDVLEIGPGSGFTAFRLSRKVQSLTVVDVAAQVVDDLRLRIGSLPNVRYVCADVTHPALDKKVDQRFDAIFLLDVFQYFANPVVAVTNFAHLLRPQGELFITFPNVLPPRGDGVNYFTAASSLGELFERSGFSHWQVFAVRLRPWSAAPLQYYRNWHRKERSDRPQTYEESWVFQRREKLRLYKPLLHILWTVLAAALRLKGDTFLSEPVTDGILGKQLVIRAWK